MNSYIKNLPIGSVFINAATDDVYIRQYNKWKYIGKDKTEAPFSDFEYYSVEHKKDIKAEIIK